MIAGKVYSIYPPAIKIMCRAFQHWADLDFDTNAQTRLTVIPQIPGNISPILKGLSVFVTGDVRWWKIKSKLLYLKWRYGRPGIHPKEMSEATVGIIELIQAEDFFSCASLVLSVTKLAAKPN
jgi:hypothetical protein